MTSNEDMIESMGRDAHIRDLAVSFLRDTAKYRYTYNFKWMGIPIIQTPQDVLAMQEVIWSIRPDLIVETGVAHGGSLVFYASMLDLLGEAGRVIGVDIDIRKENRRAIEMHPMSKRITLLEGSSTEKRILDEVASIALGYQRVLVVLDSNHSHEHVLQELLGYSPLVRKGSYLVVFDTSIEDMPEGFYPGKPWDKDRNPKTAVREFLASSDRFEIDRAIPNKLMISVAIDGFLRCTKD